VRTVAAARGIRTALTHGSRATLRLRISAQIRSARPENPHVSDVQFFRAADLVTSQVNGTSWALEPLPAKANPIAIDCPTIARCIAVGTGTIDYWNGTSWSGQPGVSSKEQLDSVSCLRAGSCVAVGDQAARALAEYWDGSHWAD